MIELSTFLEANPEAVLHGPRFAERFDSFAFDSRIIQPGQLFLAVKTERADGHDYVEAACQGGAAGVVCQRPLDLASLGATCIVVPDTQAAIQAYARHIVRASGKPVVAITGSAGKTSTKEIVAHVLGGRYRVFRNPGNYNGAYGLPIGLGYLLPEHEILVLEMGIDHFGEMRVQTQIAPPDVALVTLVAAAHVEAFGSVEAIAREKGDLVEALSDDGLAVLNGDDARVAAMRERTGAEVLLCRVEGQASGAGADSTTAADSATSADDSYVDTSRDMPAQLVATHTRVSREGTQFEIQAEGRSVPVHLPWLGAQFARAALMAVAVGRRHGMSLDEIVDRLETLPGFPGRLRPIPGRAGSLILDDSYNASPTAVIAGLDVLAGLSARTRIAVLGDMAELGVLEEEGHREVGRHAAAVCDRLVTRGRLAETIAEAAREAGMRPEAITITYTAEDAIAAVEPHLGADAVVLAKGSAVARMEQVVAGLMLHPEQARDLLVRQDAAWRQIVVLRPDRPTWVEVDLGAVAHNARQLARLAAPAQAQVMAVLKADGYGHGAVQVAHTALQNGATSCAVACVSEGEILRKAGIDAPILVLGYTPAWQAREALRLGLELTVFDRDTAEAIHRAAAAIERRARVHVKVDTGMHRLGLHPEAVPDFLRALHDMAELEVAGLFTHTARADEVEGEGRAFTDRQLAAFDALLRRLDAEGLRPPLVHAANSAVLLSRPDAHHDCVRPGIALYGLAPSAEIDIGPSGADLRPALTWRSQVAQVHELAPGEPVGYGGAWTAPRPSRVATIPVGYADGLRRAPATWRHLLIRGQKAPLVGRVSMDQTAVDVTEIEGVRQGDEVVLIGRQGEATISAEDVAGWLGTINYEVVSAILARVPRVS